MPKKRSGSIIPCVLSFVLLILGLIHINSLNGPIIMPDETGYWAAGAYFAGLDWQGVMKSSPYYGIGYGLILGPLMMIINDPLTLYHVAIVVNVVLWIASFWLLRYIAKSLCTRWKVGLYDLICFAVTVYTSFLFCTQTTYVESAVVCLFLSICALMINLSRKPSYLKVLLLGLGSIILFSFHQRTIGVTIALGLTVLLMCVNRRVDWKYLFVLILTVTICYTVFSVLKDSVIAEVYQNGSIVEYNDFGGQISKLSALLSLEGLRVLFINVIGRVLYLGAASFLLVFWGGFYLGRDVIQVLHRKFAKDDKEDQAEPFIEVKIFLILCFLASIGISAIALLYTARLDHIIYGRYSEYTIAPILAIALINLAKERKSAVKNTVFSFVQLVMAVVVYVYMTGLEFSTFGPYAISGLLGFPTLPGIGERVQFTIWVSVVAVIVSTIIIGLFKLGKRLVGLKYISVLAVSVLWIFCAFSAADKALYKEGALETAWYKFGQEVESIVGENVVYYVVDEDEINTNTYWHMFRLKYFLKDTNLVSVTEEEFEELEEPQYVILHEKSQGKQNKSENYIMVLQEAPFSLYAEISSEYITIVYPNAKNEVELPNLTMAPFATLHTINGAIEDEGEKSWKQNEILIDTTGSGKSEYAVYGPYIELPPGHYEATFSLRLLSAGEEGTLLGACDVSANGGMILGSQNLEWSDFADGDEKEITVNFASGIESLQDVEFRIYVQPDVQLELTNISYQFISSERQVVTLESNDFETLHGVLNYDTENLPVHAVIKDSLYPYVSCSQLQEALADTGREVSIVKRSELGRDPAVLLVPAEDTDLLFDLLPDFTVLVRMEKYALLVPSGYSVETAFRDVGGRPMSEGNALNLRYFLGAGEASYGNLAVNIPAGDYELRYRLSLNGTPLWSELGTLTLSGGNLSEQESLTAELFDDGYGTYENSRMLSLEESGQLRVGVSVHSGVSVVGLEAYLIRQ